MKRAVFVTGGSGYLGHELHAALTGRGLDFEALGRAEGLDLARPFDIDGVVEARFAAAQAEPLLIHAAAWSRQDACEREPENAFRANAEASGVLASLVAQFGGRMVYVSTDLVFDGEDAPYDETSTPLPISVYGRSKLLGERYVRSHARNLIVRIPLLFGPSFDGRRGASDSLLHAVSEGREFGLFTDEWRTPLDVRVAAARIVDLAITDVSGVRHLPGDARWSRYDFGLHCLQAAGVDIKASGARIMEARREDHGGARPRDCSLATVYGSTKL